MGWRYTATRWFTATQQPIGYDLLPGLFLPSFLGGATIDSLRTTADLSAASGYGSTVYSPPRFIEWICRENTSTVQTDGAGVVDAVRKLTFFGDFNVDHPPVVGR